MVDHTHLFTPGQAVTYTAGADVTGGQLVEVTGDREVSPATAASTAVAGVAAFDAPAGEHVTVLDGGVQRVTASGAVAGGDLVVAAASGAVAAAGATPDALTVIGKALTSGTDVPVEINLN